MASATSSENAATEPVDSPAYGEDEHPSIAVGGDIDDKKKGKTRRQNVPNEDSTRQDKKNQNMSQNANKAIMDGEFVWKVKPEPYIGTLRHDNGESIEDCERRIHQEIMTAYEKASKSTWVEEEGEVEIVEFAWRHYRIHWEKYLRIDWNASDEHRFANSKILERYETKKESGTVKKILKAPEKARQMMLARHYHPMGKKAFVPPSNADKPTKSKPGQLVMPKKNIGKADSQLYAYDDDSKQQLWSKLEEQFDDIMGEDSESEVEGPVDQFPKSLKQILAQILQNWKRWGNKVTKDLAFDNQTDAAAAEDSRLLRQTPKDMMFVAVDKRNKLIAFLVPSAIQDAFKHEGWVKERMETDTRHFYTHIKKPKNEKASIRHLSERSAGQKKKDSGEVKDSEEVEDSGEVKAFRGTDHYGHWHATGQTHGPMVETADSHGTSATVRQVLLHYLENTGGTMTKVLDFWFGVWEPELRQEYRRVYERSPKFARLPPTNADRPEIYTMRVNVVNRKTDMHNDSSDWEGGLTGLVQLGNFKGSEMCLKELGIRLDGYQSGAMLLFRGTEIHHFTAKWDQDDGYRYAFDHTTHESVRRATEAKKPYKEYEPPSFSENEEDIKSEADGAGSANVKDNKKKTKKPARSGNGSKKKTMKRSRSNDTDDEGDDDDEFKPVPKRRKHGKRGSEDKTNDGVSSRKLRRSRRSPQLPSQQSDV